MRADRRPDSVAKGRMRAASRGGGLIMDEVTEILNDFRRLNNEDARAAFADKWVRLASDRLEYTWPVLYELLRIIRDRKLYEVAERMEDRQARGSFEEYLEQVVRQPFEVWEKLEQTYHFVTTTRPDLAGAPFKVACGARQKAMNAAGVTTGEVQPRGGDRKSEERKSKCKLHNDIPSANERASSNNISRRTQIKLDRLARDFPQLHEKVKLGKLSINAAAIEAGLAVRTVPLPLDPLKAARVILRHFEGDRLAALIAALETGG